MRCVVFNFFFISNSFPFESFPILQYKFSFEIGMRFSFIHFLFLSYFMMSVHLTFGILKIFNRAFHLFLRNRKRF